MTSDNPSLSQDSHAPLAARMRPTSVEQYVGQQHLLGDGKPLYKMLKQRSCHSMVLWGPPGSGKTTLAELIADYFDGNLIRLSAVMSGVKDIRAAMDKAQEDQRYNQRTILFVDEVHRFNKSQQDAFLPYIEAGTVTFIGATTENPSFELNKALLSRVRVYVLESLGYESLERLLDNALTNQQRGLGSSCLTITEQAKKALIDLSSGDARRLLTYLELTADFVTEKTVELSHVEQAVGQKVASFDKSGDVFYDLLSAFHKTVRGSDPDAALYWYARILEGGGDALVVARRLLAIASEDIGNADPKALQLCLNAWDTYHRVGAAEGERAIAQAIVYCALTAKSNAVYSAFKQARALAKETSDLPVPMHLRNAPTQLMKNMGMGESYRYAHNEPNAFAAGECYFPEQLTGTTLYFPSDRGMEKSLKAKRDFLDSLNKNSDKRRY